MPTIPCNPGAYYWANPGRKLAVSFRGNGPLIFVPVHEGFKLVPNPYDFVDSDAILAARILVGFNVGARKQWKMKDVIGIVQDVRAKQKRKPDASFVAQQGIYTSSVSGKTVVEDGAQIIIVNLDRDPMPKFRKHMERLAETLARRLKQELVLLEIQKAGQTVATIGMKP